LAIDGHTIGLETVGATDLPQVNGNAVVEKRSASFLSTQFLRMGCTNLIHDVTSMLKNFEHIC
jgi:hypothetical protein